MARRGRGQKGPLSHLGKWLYERTQLSKLTKRDAQGLGTLKFARDILAKDVMRGLSAVLHWGLCQDPQSLMQALASSSPQTHLARE